MNTQEQAVALANEAATPWYELYERAQIKLAYCRAKAVVTRQRGLLNAVANG
jgi:hypothetical protein